MKQLKTAVTLVLAFMLLLGMLLMTGCTIVGTTSASHDQGGENSETDSSNNGDGGSDTEASTDTGSGEKTYALTLGTVYNLAQEAGYTGTLEDLIAMFKGEAGEAGESGVGISSAELRDGGLYIALTDGTEIYCGQLISDEALMDAIPTIGENGNWYLNGEDTGISSRGEAGEPPYIGENGNWWVGDSDSGVLAQGDIGVGVDRAEIDEDGNLIFYYTDEPETPVVVGKVQMPEPEHNFGEWVVIVEPVCQYGLGARECSDCGKTEVDMLDPVHDFEYFESKEPSCTSIGWNAYKTCKLCGLSDYEQKTELGHDASWIVQDEATCTEHGTIVYKCATCLMILDTDTIEPTGHDFDGKQCKNCGLSKNEIIIHYVYSDGTEAAPDYNGFFMDGEVYSISSPEIEGFVADQLLVSAQASDDVEITVTYAVITLQKIVRIDGVSLGRVEYNTPYSSLRLPTTVQGYTASGNAVSLKVYWDSSTYTPTAYGAQTIYGVASAGYGYMLDCSSQVSATLNVATNVVVEILPMDLGKLPLNTSYDGLGLPSTAAVRVESGAIYYVPVEWNAYEYDKTVAGEHTISGSVELSSGFSFASGVDGTAQITFELSEKMYGTADIVFLIDTTGSMWGEIQNVKNNVSKFAQDLENAGVSVRWALLEYRDITCDGLNSTKVIYCGASEWYIDVASYERAIASLSVNGGGDREETVIDALKAATYLDSREDAKTFYIVVTDADYKTNNRYDISGMNEMINELVDKETVTSVVTKTTYYDVYRNLTDRTNGILANIDGDFARELWRLTDMIAEDVVYGDVVSIEIVQNPTKTVYTAGDYFDGNGMIVRALYESGLYRDVTGYGVSPYSALQLSDTFVEINYRGKTASVSITVNEPEIPVERVTLSEVNVVLTEEELFELVATVYPTNAINKGVVWDTMNPNVATVDENGTVCAIGTGTTQIVVTTLDGAHTAIANITVNPKPVSVEGIYTDVGALELEPGDEATITVTVLPSNATNKNVIWSSSNESVVTVENGVVTAVSDGTATITVTTVDGEFSARVFVEVKTDKGSFTGRVYQSDSSLLLSGVTVELIQNGVAVATATTDSMGTYKFENVSYGQYKIVYSKDGYVTAERTYTVQIENDQLDNTYLARDISSLPGYVTGYAKDATTANGISGIKVYVRAGAGNTTGEIIQTLTTSSSGYYTTNGLTPGNYTLQFVDESSSSTKYISQYINVAVTGDTTLSNQNVALVKPVGANSMKIVLSWGSSPSDLDSHLNIQTGSSTYHVYYSTKAPSGANASLDVDDTSYYGPETITVTSIYSNGVYTYYVHNYSGGNTEIQNSNAVVTLTIGDRAYTFNAPNGSGLYWNVFTYNAQTGELTVNNVITNTAP